MSILINEALGQLLRLKGEARKRKLVRDLVIVPFPPHGWQNRWEMDSLILSRNGKFVRVTQKRWKDGWTEEIIDEESREALSTKSALRLTIREMQISPKDVESLLQQLLV